ncbi:ABC transporter ATP-binding protein [Bryobacter aggregatus]|uniref:ATP-binding cassette domain-containing protein n=1 Tax=Bryobacter aggregatus TaxID=360054 RepID=UPI0012BB0D54|nr:ABC transporter ATP-binding protein [Bryobacter aggregatus]
MEPRLKAAIAALPAPTGRVDQEVEGAARPPGGCFWKQMRETGLLRRFLSLLLCHIAATGMLLLAWAAIGQGALSGRLDRGWVLAWALCLATTLPLRSLSTWLEGTFAVGLGGLLKQRLLAGAMTIDADLMKRMGAGQLLSQSMEAESIERSAVGGGMLTVLALLELLFAAGILSQGVTPWLTVAGFGIWVAANLLVAAWNTRQRAAWTSERLRLTHRLVEKMTGHRTRLAQQPPADWHVEEDTENVGYLNLSRRMDQTTAWLSSVMPRGYLLVGIASLVPAFLSAELSTTQLALSLGGILFAYAALSRFAFGMARLGAAWVSWTLVKPIFTAAGRVPEEGILRATMGATDTVLDVQELMFTHAGRREPTLQGCSLTIRRGDFLLLEGGSGGGKSTLAAILAGLRPPQAGLLLASGLDRQTLGDAGWRQRIVTVPQFHENHLMAASFCFNLLLGRADPHTEQDKKEAWELCQELGLGPLLARMPSGMETMVGETGWQLSQGERSRLFLGRALLQGGDLVLLDESFAALDPDNMRQCLECVFQRAKTLLVIAHP